LLGLVMAAGALVVAAEAQEPVRYVRAKSAGAIIRNFQDRQGLAVREIGAGGLMRVFGESVGFLDVQAAGGFQVWVFGKYLDATSDPSIFRVNASSVLMRPQAGASTANMPIRTKLQRGDRVEMIGRQDEGKDFADDWIQIWSPDKARGWVLATDVTDVGDLAAAQAEWKRTQRVLPIPSAAAAQPKTTTTAKAPEPKAETPKPAVASAPRSGMDAAELLAVADALFERAVEADQPDFAAVSSAYQRVIDTAVPGSSTAQLALRRLDETKLRAKFAMLEQEVEKSHAERASRLEEIKQEQERRQLSQTAHWGRFNGRGWVEKEMILGEPHYFLSWGGETVAEVTCSSGRYDLAVFDGYEIGGMGIQVSPARQAELGKPGRARVLDLMKIEVISGSGARR